MEERLGEENTPTDSGALKVLKISLQAQRQSHGESTQSQTDAQTQPF